MRLFIAINPEDGLRREVQRIQGQMREQGVTGRYTKPENLHVTLAFIGEYAHPEGVLDVISSLPFDPLRLAVRGLGAFQDVWWLGIEPSDALSAYVERLRRALADAGIPFDRRSFVPHMTLIRGARYPGVGLPALDIPEIELWADHAALMRSDRGADGMIYTEIPNKS